MNNKKIFISIIMSLTLLGSVQAFASDGNINPFEINKERENQVIQAILNGEELPPENEYPVSNISPLEACAECSVYMPSVCAADATVDAVRTHNYLGGTCTRTILVSRGALVCGSCEKVDWIPGQHWCWDVHADCGRGEVDACPMDVS